MEPTYTNVLEIMPNLIGSLPMPTETELMETLNSTDSLPMPTETEFMETLNSMELIEIPEMIKNILNPIGYMTKAFKMALKIFFPNCKKIPKFTTTQQIAHVVSMLYKFIEDPNACLKSKKLDEIEQINLKEANTIKVNEYIDCQEINNVVTAVKKGYQFKYIFKRIIQVKPSFCGDKEYLKISKELKEHAAKALQESIYKNAGLRYIKLLLRSYFKVNLKDEYKNELWFFKGYFIGQYLNDDALKATSETSIKRINDVVASFLCYVKKILHDNEELIMLVDEDRENINQKTNTKVQKIANFASQATFEMEPIQNAESMFENLLENGIIKDDTTQVGEEK